MNRVLSVGSDISRLRMRQKALARAGFTSVSCSVEGALAELRGSDIDAVILDPTLTEEQRNRIAAAVKQRRPGAKIVMLYDGSITNAELGDAIIGTGHPERLVEALQGLLGERNTAAGI